MDKQQETRKNKEAMKIATWNCNGKRGRKDELSIFLQEEEVEIMLLQETRLRQRDALRMTSYQTFRKDRTGQTEGGVAILVKNRYTAREVQVETQIEVIAVEIMVHGRKLIRIMSAYNKPSNAIAEKDLEESTQTTCYGIRI